MPDPIVVQVVVDKPLSQGFDYLWDAKQLGVLPQVGQIIEVPFGRGQEIAVVIKVSAHSDYQIDKIKYVDRVSPLPPLNLALLRLMNFASQYYVHALGETILPTIPQMWKKADSWKKNVEKINEATKKKNPKVIESQKEGFITAEQLNAEQKKALEALNNPSNSGSKFRTILLQGQTGSGKTAVFLNWISRILEEKDAPVLLLVPEINLTPQLERRVRAYFPDKIMAVLHSGVTEKKRGIAWYEAMTGKAQIILGTRLAALTPMPNLRAIVVDEEHDTSYKQQEGTRYSARDLAIWRAHDGQFPIVLSSATPSLETWIAAKAGRYEYIRLDQRAQGAKLPRVHLINTRDPRNQYSPGDEGAPKTKSLISKTLAQAISKNYQEQKQSLILINRRGYAPVLSCSSCNWLSKCSQCSSYMVMHKPGALGKRSVLNCHHCGLVKSIPQFCPDCGNIKIFCLCVLDKFSCVLGKTLESASPSGWESSDLVLLRH